MSGWPPLNGPRWIAPTVPPAPVPAIVWTNGAGGGPTGHSWSPTATNRFEEEPTGLVGDPDAQWTLTAWDLNNADPALWELDPRSFSGGDGLTIEVPDGDGIVCGMVWTTPTSWPSLSGLIMGNWGDAADPDYPRWEQTGPEPQRGDWATGARDGSYLWCQSEDGVLNGWIAPFWYDRSDPRLGQPITNGYDVTMYGWAINVPILAPRYQMFNEGDTPTDGGGATLTVTGEGLVIVVVESI